MLEDLTHKMVPVNPSKEGSVVLIVLRVTLMEIVRAKKNPPTCDVLL